MRLTFGDCVFDSGTREVFRGGKLASVSPKAFRLLEILAERRPNAVSKEELHHLLWPNTFVSDANLPNLVVELRTALGDGARSQRILRTVPRFGYAFAADAAVAPEKGPARSRTPFACRLIWGPREIALDPGENLIGRDRDAVVWIDDESVSRRHARIVVDDSGATLEDLGSKNGTFVGGTKIKGRAGLVDQDAIKIGPASMVFRVFKRTGSTASTVEERTSS
jgi:DNA-binding winged helix-turn-helix (wHTH) protein